MAPDLSHGELVFLCDTPSMELVAVGLLREQVLHRYAQYCNIVRGRPLIDQ